MTDEKAQARLQQLYNDFLPIEYDFTEYDTEDAKLDREALQMGIKALEQQPNDDCISRKAIKDMLTNEWTKYMPMELDINLSFVLEKISELPSVIPIRPHGEWIHFTDDFKDYVACSCCGYGEEGEVLLEDKTPFCPVCGADMREGETDAG